MENPQPAPLTTTGLPYLLRALLAGFGWLSVVIQFYLITYTFGLGFPESVWRFFSFFTIVTNLLSAAVFGILVAAPASKSAKNLNKLGVLTALTSYMVFLALVYHVLLRHLWQPQGLQWVNDQLLHTINPLLLLAYWWFYVPKHPLRWHFPLYWLAYPAVYLVWVLLRGAASGFYPYPFLNVAALGYPQTLLNIGFLSVGLLVVGWLHLAIGKTKEQYRRINPYSKHPKN